MMGTSDDPVQQAGWEALDASGALPRRAAAVGPEPGRQQAGPVPAVTADMTWTEARVPGEVSVAITATSTALQDSPALRGRPVPGLDTVAGEYRGVVALTIPKTATAPAAGAPSCS